MRKRALLVINQNSRSGDTYDDARHQLSIRGIDFFAESMNDPARIRNLIQARRHEIDVVIVGGGDGSLNAIAPVLVETSLPLAILPMGTANDLARTLQIPTEIDQAIDVIANGIQHRIDLGMVNGHYFFNVANIGLGVRVMHNMSPDQKRRWGVFSYAQSLFKALRSYRSFRADIVCDGRHLRVRSIQIAVGNGRHYGGGMTVTDDAHIDDGRFCLYSIAPAHLWDLIKLTPALRSGIYDSTHPMHIERGTHVEIFTRKPMPVTADGELITHTPARFTMHSGALSVFVPASYLKYRKDNAHAA